MTEATNVDGNGDGVARAELTVEAVGTELWTWFRGWGPWAEMTIPAVTHLPGQAASSERGFPERQPYG